MASNCFDGSTCQLYYSSSQLREEATMQSKQAMETNSSAASPNSSALSDSTNQPAAASYFASSMYSSIFPQKFTLPSSLSLTPSTLSDDDGDHHDDDCNTMHRLGQAQLVLECEELRNHLRDLNNEVDSLRRENAVLRSANTDLVKLLSSPAALHNFLNASTYLNTFMADELKPLGVGVFSPRDGDEASDISPTSVIMERNRFNADRFSLPKSISVRSSGYKKVNPSFGANQLLQDGPARVPKEGSSGAMQVKVKAYNQGMLKTELCNKWEESGACPYGDNCQFAHGVRELRPVMRHPRYKTQICRMVLTRGTCPYGHRCHFRHSLNDQHR
ncbi:putative transcription factor C3H family [Rosa chinensis]|uniref:Putative transcription factor C3H family n=1 Tax=Rosa chinensis TaxID=74649 RepID=A0A2P6QUN5_ROSCH|nr:zinc finger CCCH domain-containing protein 14 [Rosa chinensis]PRQ37877.1 putative transcription factor C3H family [Rosa chinensis]